MKQPWKIDVGYIFAPVLIVFISLKLGKVLDWSWWWVLSPIGGMIILALIIIIINFIYTKKKGFVLWIN